MTTASLAALWLLPRSAIQVLLILLDLPPNELPK
jgi:hypothetical protein